MTDSSIDMLAPERLARLLDVDTPAVWTEADATAALRHQLAAPLLPDLALAPGSELDHLRPFAEAYPTLLAALTAPSPPLGLLQAIKRWARHVRNDSASPLSRGPATVLYYAAIAAAREHPWASITSLTPDQLHKGFSWSMAFSGAEALARLFPPAMRTLSQG
jgi:hypothetical protein